ncbi:MAG: hypothetical protein ACJ754_07240 [Pyrinomonadaceae bacterium]
MTGITHKLSGATQLNVSFKYDAAGNRKWMEYNRPEAGSSKDNVTYDYDVLSRLTKETHHFANLTDPDDTVGSSPPSTHRLFSLTYSYDHVGRVTSAWGPYGDP